jgi:hypothetical protein
MQGSLFSCQRIFPRKWPDFAKGLEASPVSELYRTTC